MPLAMLDSLRRIVQEVNGARDFARALEIIVLRLHEAIGTEVCSIYLYDRASRRFVLSATEGLNKELVGKVSLTREEGLVGQVARREEPVNIDDAVSHPSFRLLPELGEEPFRAFLGVPIVHQREVLGVLVVQQRRRRRFDEEEESFLVTLSAQLAAVIAHAEATGALAALRGGSGGAVFHGQVGATGIGIGEAVVVSPPADLDAVPSRRCDDPAAEVKYFKRSLAAVRRDIRKMARKLSPQLGKAEAGLFDVYISMLQDRALGREVIERIREGEWAQGALSEVIREHARAFEMLEDDYMRDRAVDIKDLGRRVLAWLQSTEEDQREYPEHTILVGEELSAAMLAEVPPERLAGMVSVRGSRNSHMAIMARALGIPTVIGAVDLPFTRLENKRVVVDGYSGEVICEPSAELLGHYLTLREEDRQISRDLSVLRDLPCETLDGHRLTLFVNTGLMTEVAHSLDQGAEGVGLYRTEIPFLLKDRFPTEEEQRQIYREQLAAFHPRPVTMRTLDIGGDKSLPYFPIVEDNPFLGWRGIRVTLDHPELFLAQVRAMMKASVGLDNLRIMLPMISSVLELEEALELLYRAHEELLEDNLKVSLPPVGVMIEVPAAVYQARELARRVDFLSVGSNDLAQYLLAVDRNNARVAHLYHTYHPAVLRALYEVVTAAHREGKPVSICGEMAGEPGAAILLLGMGFDMLSMSANRLARVKAALRQVDTAQATKLLRESLACEHERDVQDCVTDTMQRLGVEIRFMPGSLRQA